MMLNPILSQQCYDFAIKKRLSTITNNNPRGIIPQENILPKELNHCMSIVCWKSYSIYLLKHVIHCYQDLLLTV